MWLHSCIAALHNLLGIVKYPFIMTVSEYLISFKLIETDERKYG